MSQVSDGADDGGVDPAEALGVIANETHLDILEALWRVAVDVPLADDCLTVVLDGDLNPVDTERRTCRD
ncbi:MAG: hypothetical protein ABEJ85_03095 [Haloarculaceae archaeon]